jgi:hypothetical protein
MSKYKSKLFRELLFPIGMLIVLTGLVIWKKGNLESFDWLVIIVLAGMLLARVIEWLFKCYTQRNRENTDQEKIEEELN